MINGIHLTKALAGWRIPDLPAETGGAKKGLDIEAVKLLIRRNLVADPKDGHLQIAVIDWLYKLVRGNIKRGRIFELGEVLITRQADCLGYTQLLSALGNIFGLELGIVEVLIDNAGRYVPHHVNLLNLPDGNRRFIDAWYGSTNINHRRIGALVDGVLRDIDATEPGRVGELKGLPEGCIEAIILYIKGNRSLQREEPDKAIRYYSRAIRLYPNNSRAFYNRALAYEMKGELKKAELDYARALKDESGLIRVLSTTCDLEDLIKLDEKGINETEQGVYLFYKGFRTGAPTSYEEISRKCGLPVEEVSRIVSRVESRVRTD